MRVQYLESCDRLSLFFEEPFKSNPSEDLTLAVDTGYAMGMAVLQGDRLISAHYHKFKPEDMMLARCQGFVAWGIHQWNPVEVVFEASFSGAANYNSLPLMIVGASHVPAQEHLGRDPKTIYPATVGKVLSCSRRIDREIRESVHNLLPDLPRKVAWGKKTKKGWMLKQLPIDMIDAIAVGLAYDIKHGGVKA